MYALTIPGEVSKEIRDDRLRQQAIASQDRKYKGKKYDTLE